MNEINKSIFPTYTLDENFDVIDFNYGFDFIMKQIGLSLSKGDGISKFVEYMDNEDESRERAIKVFGSEVMPLSDTEVIEMSFQDYGKVLLQKIALRFQDTWVVSYNFNSWESGNLLDDYTSYLETKL